MEDNRNFATFFADAPKGKKIGAVLSWIATAILLVALFVPGFQMNFEKKDQNGKWKTISEKTDAYDYETAKESWAIKIQLHASAESEKLTDCSELSDGRGTDECGTDGIESRWKHYK